MADPKLCSIPACDKQAAHKGWCKAHYARWHRHGDPLGGSTSKGELLRFLNEIVLPYDGEDCLSWPYMKDRKGYGQIRIDSRLHTTSRLVCEAVYGPAPTPDHQAAHSCGNGHLGCVNPHHLSWKTPKGNSADAITHGTTTRGERNSRSKLTADEALKILSLKGTMTQSEIGKMFGVSYVTVSDIHTGRRWGWLTHSQ